jgi:formate hydrogenlyase subunit 3/multisubunit Na+/H+ antiporter MnhD subunit
VTSLTALLLATPGVPALVTLLWPIRRLRWGLRAAPLAATPGLVLSLVSFGGPSDRTSLLVPQVFMGLELSIDPTSRALLLLSSALWLVAGVFALRYHKDDPRADTFFGFFVLTMTGSLGTVVAGDLLTFYLFFALMTFAAYGLVVHRRDAEALRAGRIYVLLAVLGEAMLLGGLVALGALTGQVPSWGGEIEGAWRLAEGQGGSYAQLTALLLVVGLGVKAGLVPLHVWLPLAHPVAPTAASALLSGAIIKAGVLGWLRLLPAETALPDVGGALLAAGAIAALWGVVAGLPQRDPKTILAYSSVSQMGYAAMGVGLLLHGPALSARAVAAVVVFAVHHGLAKGALFLAVGVVDRSGGARGVRRALLTAASLPALALAGAPLTTGALAKGELKHVITALGGAWYAVSGAFFFVAALGTTLLMVRFLVALASRAADGAGDVAGAAPAGLLAPWLVLVAAGASGPIWLWRLSPLGDAAGSSRTSEGLPETMLPLVIGAAVGWAVLRAPDLAGAVGRVRIPAGDLLVAIERLLRKVPRLDQEAWAARSDHALVRTTAPVASQVRNVAVHLAALDIRVIRGAVMGAALMSVAFSIALALLAR